MKRFVKFCTFLMVLMVVFGLCTTAYADGSVTYYGVANKFIFYPGTKESPTNLFENFQNVMPGDTLTEKVEIRNPKSNGIKLRVYMRSKGAQEQTNAFLSQLSLEVRQDGDSILFSAPADQTAQLTDWTYLGTVYSGGKITLDVTLKVPITMGDGYQNDIGYIDWEFKVEELPISSSDPKTGDESNLGLYVGLMVVSLAVIIFLVIFKRKKKEETD